MTSENGRQDEQRIKVGTVSTTSGILFLVDPNAIVDPQAVQKAVVGALQSWEIGGSPIDELGGVAFRADVSDRQYDVFTVTNEFEEGGKAYSIVKRLEIVLHEQPDIDESREQFRRALARVADMPACEAEAETDPTLVGSVLARLCVMRGWTRGDLADHLGVLPDTLAELYAEPRPNAVITRGGALTFHGAVTAIAGKYPMDSTETFYEAYRDGLDALAADGAPE